MANATTARKPEPSNQATDRILATKPILLTYQQVADRYGFKLGTLACWVARKQIPHKRLSPRMVKFDPAELDAWLATKSVPVAK